MKFREYIQQLSSDELEIYAKDAGTTVSYIRTHLYYGYKEPRKSLRKALAEASNGKVTEVEVLQHFGLYPTNPIKHLNGNKATV
ncbi:hypothetical protein [Acinetobacter variabilis]|uniref:hypothetical protein n=1 Tax=Acinetobacter variabilis TaxID=70346 RepID=UPI001BB49FD8|nr:hypothetical protein [Acinetobacter variabilis]BCT88950.1 hypothetical protein RYU24_13550 [Acinetobacter variabilis]